MSVSLSDLYFRSNISILGGFKERLNATVDVVYFLYAFNVKTINKTTNKKIKIK